MLKEPNTFLDFGQIGMCLHDVADEHVLLIPDAVEVIRHEVDPVCVAQESQKVEVLEVPVGGRRCECQSEIMPRGGELRDRLVTRKMSMEYSDTPQAVKLPKPALFRPN